MIYYFFNSINISRDILEKLDALMNRFELRAQITRERRIFHEN